MILEMTEAKQQVKIKWAKIFGCPDCKKKFDSLLALNIHYTKRHPEKKRKFYVHRSGHGVSKYSGPRLRVKQDLT